MRLELLIKVLGSLKTACGGNPKVYVNLEPGGYAKPKTEEELASFDASVYCDIIKVSFDAEDDVIVITGEL